ncbi:dienelactone hydrolase [Melanogaster broomeanus]|nr:dienelactone hydrolase [Melanogaster broomeanus]
MSLCSHCISGVRHEGEPEGKIEEIGGVKCYIATPTVEYPKNKVVLFLPDVWGIELVNARLLADDFSRNGFKVVAIDYLNGDAIPSEVMNLGTFDLGTWFKSHGSEQTRPPLDKVIAALKEQGVTDFAATGYCFGGRYAFDLAFDKVLKVVAVAHPSLLTVPVDLEKFKETGLPLLINSCETDSQFPPESQTKADEILGGGTMSSELYKREYFAGCTHGFTIRGDLSVPEVKAGKEGAFKATVEFFLKHL